MISAGFKASRPAGPNFSRRSADRRGGAGAFRTIELQALRGIHRDRVAAFHALGAVVLHDGGRGQDGGEGQGGGERQRTSFHRFSPLKSGAILSEDRPPPGYAGSPRSQRTQSS